MFAFITNKLQAGFDFNDNCKAAYKSIINIKFKEGKRLIDIEKSSHPDNNLVIVLDNYIDFLTLFITEQKKLFTALEPNEDARIKALELADSKSPFYLYSQATIYLQWAFTRLKFEDYFTAALEIHKAYILLEKNNKLYPDFVPNKLELGILHVLIGTIPDDYKWASNLIGFKGSIQQGMNELYSVLLASLKKEEYSYLKTEALFFSSFIHLNLKNNPEEVRKYYTMIKSCEDNTSPLLVYSQASIAMRSGANDEAITLLMKRPVGEEYQNFYYLDYLLGLAKLNRLDNDCRLYFEKYANTFKGINYIKSAYQKIAWSYLLAGDNQKYKEYMLRVKSYGNSLLDDDKMALKEAEENIVPNIVLLKARLLFDGGYYQKSLDVLLEHKPSEVFHTSKELLEFTYRLARIYHKWNNIEKAIFYYDLTLRNGENQPYYFAANSALQLGQIYENQKNTEKAKSYYEKCLSLKKTEYKNSLDQKAKAGLNRLGY